MPYISGTTDQDAKIIVLDSNKNTIEVKDISSGSFTIDDLSTTSGIVIATSNSGETLGYNKINFASYSELEASGGMITTISGYRIHTFLTSGTFVITNNDTNKLIDNLVVAGGGGGAAAGAGGGAGGLVYSTNVTISAGSYPVVVGTGGTGAPAVNTAPAGGTKGNNSTFNGITAEGGGRGLSHGSTSADGGGCGAGGAITTGGSATPGGIGSQGYNGGAGYVQASWVGCCGGGGGMGQAGSAGGNSSGSGKGGNGVANSITGTSITYAGGGGGGEINGAYVGAGGTGGGGSAVIGGTGSVGAGGAGTNGLGGGGAGGSYYPNSSPYYKAGGNGGSGVVNIRYPWTGSELITSLPWTETFTGTDDTLPSSTYWLYSGGNIKIYNNKLRITIDSTYNRALISNFYISGNFDIQVDITMSTAPSTQNWSSSLYAVADNSNRFWAAKNYYNSQLYWSGESSIGGSSLGDIAVSASYTGKLRLVRNSQTITCYYHNGTSWVQTHTRGGFPLADVRVHLFAGIATNVFTTVTDFDNFVINSASKIYRT